MKQCITVIAFSCSLSVGLCVAAWSQPQDSVRTRADRERELESILDNYRAKRPALKAVPNTSSQIPVAITTTAESTTRIAAQTVLPSLILGEMSVSEAWQKKALSLDDVKWILGEYVDAWGGFNWKSNVTLRRELARIAWEQGGAELHTQALAPKAISRSLRLWLADYLGSVGDERAIAICE